MYLCYGSAVWAECSWTVLLGSPGITHVVVPVWQLTRELLILGRPSLGQHLPVPSGLIHRQLDQDSANFCVKAQAESIFGFVGHLVPGAAIPHCCYNVKAVINATFTNGHDCFPVKVDLQKQVMGWIWPMSPTLLVPELNQTSSHGAASSRELGQKLSGLLRPRPESHMCPFCYIPLFKASHQPSPVREIDYLLMEGSTASYHKVRCIQRWEKIFCPSLPTVYPLIPESSKLVHTLLAIYIVSCNLLGNEVRRLGKS